MGITSTWNAEKAHHINIYDSSTVSPAYKFHVRSGNRKSHVVCVNGSCVSTLQFKLSADKGEQCGRFRQTDHGDYTPINGSLSQTTCNFGFISWNASICHGACQPAREPRYPTHNLGNIKTCTHYECTIVLVLISDVPERMQIKLRGITF